jgi:hypothetical protein
MIYYTHIKGEYPERRINMIAYETEIAFYQNGKYVGGCTFDMRLGEKLPKDTELELTWNNILDYYERCGGLFTPFGIEHRKKGLILKYWDGWKVYKSWKEPISITVKNLHEDISDTVSINDILKYKPGDDAIKFLVERGLKI